MENTPLEWIVIFLVVVAPMLGITLRLGCKPLVDAIVRLHQALGEGGSRAERARLAELESTVRHLEAAVQRLQEADDFATALLQPAGASPPARLPSPAERRGRFANGAAADAPGRADGREGAA